MTTVDYIIIGQGLAGTAIAQQLHQRGLTFRVVDYPDSNQASRVASGIWNPIVLKRMKKVWKADAMLEAILPFYNEAESLLSDQFIDNIKVHRVFASDKEIDAWFELSDDPRFEDILSAEINRSSEAKIDHRSGLAAVVQSGRINTEEWLNSARRWFAKNGFLIEDRFDHYKLHLEDQFVKYQNLQANGIIFCEGMHAAASNPYFDYLPFALTKGEVLIIRSEELQLDQVINSSVFVLPLGNNLYKVGATYAWDDLSLKTTEKAKEELIEKAKRIIQVPFKVVEQKTGIRPTTRDRRPFLGTHPKYPQVHIFNGMGSRGVLMVPYLSQCFVDHLKGKDTIPTEANIKRFEKFYD